MLYRLKRFIINNFYKRRVHYKNKLLIDDRHLRFSFSQYSIVIYFNANVNSIYQIEQWLPIFEELNKKHKLLFVVRKKSSFEWLIKRVSNPVIFCHTQKDLIKTYEENNFKLILYVNNGVENFQSLAYRNAFHIHINHGESEKISTFSNQVNAYNYVFIVAQAAYYKYYYNLLEKDMKKFIKVGRPQLEYIHNIEPIKTDKKIVLYAPTWEGTQESMNYTSLDTFGYEMILKLINSNKYYIIYKPHPASGVNSKLVKTNHNKIINLLNNYKDSKVILSGDINSLYKEVDIAIFDNSAVTIDYLVSNKPFVITDKFYKSKDRLTRPTILKAGIVIDENNYKNIVNIIDSELKEDSKTNIRKEIKEYYLGNYDYERKESTKKFINTISKLIEKRDNTLQKLQNLKSKDL